MNARKELLTIVAEHTDIECASINYFESSNKFAVRKEIELKIGYSEKDYEDFLMELNLAYNPMDGEQNLFGTIWFKDNTWCIRKKEEGTEWWDHQTIPKIPERFK